MLRPEHLQRQGGENDWRGIFSVAPKLLLFALRRLDRAAMSVFLPGTFVVDGLTGVNPIYLTRCALFVSISLRDRPACHGQHPFRPAF